MPTAPDADNPYSFSVKLKQHTPMIHFQWQQEGATLRASELKPKLDRFIWEVLMKQKPDWFEEKSEFLGKACFPEIQGHQSGTYTVHIKAIGKPIYYLIGYIKGDKVKETKQDFIHEFNLPSDDVKHISIAPFFAENEKLRNLNWVSKEGNIIKVGVMWKGGVEVVFRSMIPDFSSWLGKIAEYFFCIENFATRQSKGFGCFTPDSWTQSNFETVITQFFGNIFKKQLNDNLTEIFKSIHGDYQLLKAGRNDPYQKSYLFLYFCDKNIRWEKRIIKKSMKLIIDN
jgi:hypothetical protein